MAYLARTSDSGVIFLTPDANVQVKGSQRGNLSFSIPDGSEAKGRAPTILDRRGHGPSGKTNRDRDC